MTLATSKNDFIISDKRYKKFRKENRETTIRRCPMSNGLATVGRKHSLFTGRNLQKDQA